MPKDINPEETYTLTGKQLQSLFDRLDAVEGKTGVRRPKRVKEHVAVMRQHDGKLVVGVGTAKELKDKGLCLPLVLEGSDKLTWVNYLDFLNADNLVNVKVVSQKAEEHIDTGGSFPKIDQKTDQMMDEQIELEVLTVSYEVTVEVLDDGDFKGHTLTVPSTALNI
jgi:hypothetical protein